MPVYAAGLFKYLRCGAKLAYRCQFALRDGVNVVVQNVVNGVEHHLSAQYHQAVMHCAYIIGIGYRQTDLSDDVACINLVLQEEGGDTRLRVAVDD
jgi:hypothetical protein